MLKSIRQYQSAFSVLFISAYLFAVLFSGLFHTHNNHFSAENFSLKTSPTSNKLVNFGTNEDCFSCHFLHEGNAILSPEIFFNINDFQFSKRSTDILLFSFSQENVIFFSLRAPPVVI